MVSISCFCGLVVVGCDGGLSCVVLVLSCLLGGMSGIGLWDGGLAGGTC